jgi:hypothetical protein
MMMTTSDVLESAGKPLRNKKKRSAVFIVIIASIAVHLLGLGGLAAIKIIEVLQPEPEFEAPPIVEMKPPPPPPPPPPTTKRSQRSLPRPQPLAVKNAQNTSVPAIEMNNANLTVGGGRGFGGGLGELGGAVAESLRITSFGFDRAMEGTLEGTLYDFKKDAAGDPIKRSWNMRDYTEVIERFSPTIREFSRTFNLPHIDRKFYKADKHLYGSYFIIPWGQASIAPKSFGVEGIIAPTLIGAHYTGSFKPTESGRFRFFGRADDVLIVRINGKIVLDGSILMGRGSYSNWRQGSIAKRHDEAEGIRSYFSLPPGFHGMTGNWFTLTEGQSTRMEVLIAEVPGGDFGAYLLIEKEGDDGLKIFSTRPLSDQDKAFLRNLHPDAAQFIK